jgi:hypothetical protein
MLKRGGEMKLKNGTLIFITVLLLTAGEVSNAYRPKTYEFGPRAPESPTSIGQLRTLADYFDPKRLIDKRQHGPKCKFLIGRNLEFYAGDLPVLIHRYGYEKTDEMPLLIPLARLIQLDDLRAFLSQAPERDPKFWSDYFKAADVIMELSLGAIAARSLPPAELHELVKAHDGVIQKMFEKRAPNIFAKTRKPRLTYVKPNLRYTRSGDDDGVFVSVSMSPEGGELHIIMEGPYQVALTQQQEPPWEQLFPPGRFFLPELVRYRAIWPGNVTKSDVINVFRLDPTDPRVTIKQDP